MSAIAKAIEKTFKMSHAKTLGIVLGRLLQAIDNVFGSELAGQELLDVIERQVEALLKISALQERLMRRDILKEALRRVLLGIPIPANLNERVFFALQDLPEG